MAIYKDISSNRVSILNEDQISILKKATSNPTLFGLMDRDILELHVYDSDNLLLDSNYTLAYNNAVPDENHLQFNLVENLDSLSGFFGNINVELNFFRNYVGGPDQPSPIITEISPSRLEVRIKTPSPGKSQTSNGILDSDFLNFVDPSFREFQPIYKELYVLNFGGNNIIPIVNYAQDRLTVPDSPHSIILKFSEPLSRDIQVGRECWIAQPMIQSVSFPLSVTSQFTPEVEVGNPLLGPNFFVNLDLNYFSNTTDYESYNTLLAADDNTKTDLINKYFSGSLQGINLGIDFKNYDEFIHFSSAEERLRNFRYKLQLVEQYDTQIANLTTKYSSSDAYTGSADVTASAEFITNKNKWQGRRDQMIGSFDPYEYYLYYESSSYSTSSYGEFTPTTWPKTNSIKPFTLAKVNSDQAVEWFGNVSDHTGQLYSSSIYDLNNPYILRNTIPAHIREKTENADYVTYVDMMGQHYDILYNYVDHMGKLYNRDERLYRGLSKDLIFDSLKSFGWDAVSGFNLEELWTYALGTDSSGSYANSSLDPDSVGQYVTSASNPATLASLGYGASVPREDIAKEIWNRLLTNLPYLYKTKGTKRGIQALMTCYGIPSTILEIREYGGPEVTQSANSNFQYDRFNYALNFDGTGYINCDWNPVNQTTIPAVLQGLPRMQEFRVRLSGTSDYSLLVNSGSSKPKDIQWGIISQYSSSNTDNFKTQGRLTFVLSGSNGYASASTAYLPLYDGDWWNINLATSEPATSDQTINNQTWILKVKKAADNSAECGAVDGRITHTGSATIDSSTDTTISNLSASYNSAWATSGSNRLRIGGSPMNTVDSSFPSLMFTGSMQEYRQYMEQLNDGILDAHTLSPLSVIGNNYSASFDLLVRRYTLGSDLYKPDRATYTTISSSHTNQSINQYSTGSLGGSTSASAVGFTIGTGYSDFEETYFTRIPDLVGSRPINKKIRIEDNELFSQSLSPDLSFQTSSWELSPLDLNKVSISLSPTNNIDIDIAYQFGGLSFDDFVGDPRDQFKTQYSELTGLQYAYKKKLNSRYNIYAFLRLMKYFDKALFLQIERMLPARTRPFVGITIEPNLLERPKIRGTNLSGSFGSLSPISDPPQADLNISNDNASDVYISISQSDVPYYNDLQSGISASIFSNKVTGRYQQYDGSMYSWKDLIGAPTSSLLYPLSASQSGSHTGTNSGSWQQIGAITGSEPDGLTARILQGAGYIHTKVNSNQLFTSAHNFNIPIIPEEATINGFELTVRRNVITGSTIYQPMSASAQDKSVYLTKNTSSTSEHFQGTNKAYDGYPIGPGSTPYAYDYPRGENLPTPRDITYGSPTDLWGQTWTPAEVNSNSFGVQFACKITGSTSYGIKVHTDFIGLKVYYQILANNPYWLRNPIQVDVSGSTLSEFRQIKNGFFTSSNITPIEADISASLGTYESSSFEYARVQDYLPTSIDRLFYDGSSLFSELVQTAGSQSGIYAINASGNDSASNYQSSSAVPDNKPVIEVFTTTNNVYYVRAPGLDKTEATSPDITVPFSLTGNDTVNPNKPPQRKRKNNN